MPGPMPVVATAEGVATAPPPSVAATGEFDFSFVDNRRPLAQQSADWLALKASGRVELQAGKIGLLDLFPLDMRLIGTFLEKAQASLGSSKSLVDQGGEVSLCRRRHIRVLHGGRVRVRDAGDPVRLLRRLYRPHRLRPHRPVRPVTATAGPPAIADPVTAPAR